MARQAKGPQVIPAEAVEAAAPWITNFLERRGLVLRGKEADVLAGYVLEAAAPYMLTEAAPKLPKHQCEPWQIQVNGSGTFRYCAACGEPQP